ncbi:MAG TPA: LLM class flavin-dependent oxidoreductase, partial [Acidimicrobiales bacterium]
WDGEVVDHDGRFHRYEGARVQPLPAQDRLEVWLGGIAPSELRRCGRLGDGWLPSFCTPDDVRQGIAAIERHASEADRKIDPEHFGALLPYCDGPVPDVVAAALAKRRPDVDPAQLVSAGMDALAQRIGEHVEAGASKFVVLPLTEPDDWDAHLAAVADALLPLQT